MANRVLETVKGRDEAVRYVKMMAVTFNEFNGQNRMELTKSGLEAWDTEGSGEFYEAVCLNANDPEISSCDEEIYEIQTCW